MASSVASLAVIALVTESSAGPDGPFWNGPNGEHCPHGHWAAGSPEGHTDSGNDQCCSMGRGGDTQNCDAPEIYHPAGDDNPDVCCYWREELNEYFYRPSRIVAKWVSIGAYDPTVRQCATVGTEIDESYSENFEHQVTDSLKQQFGIEFEGLGSLTGPEVTHEVTDKFSNSHAWSTKQTESTEGCDVTEVIQEYQAQGLIWKWQWSADTTTMWGTEYTTFFDDTAYTLNAATPPLCAAGFYAEDHFPDYQLCAGDEGGEAPAPVPAPAPQELLLATLVV